jgi:translation initiation factor 2 subunit 2
MSSEKEYEQLLDNIYSNLPKKADKAERFEMPSFEYFSEGNKTIIKNFRAVCEKIRREPDYLSKFLSKELAVPAEITGDRLILQRKIVGDMLNKKLEEFITKYVVCKQCNRPDTHVEGSGRLRTLVCESCGAQAAIR